MSLIPLGERRGDGDTPSREEPEPDTLLGRLWASARAVLSTLRDLFTDPESAAESSESDESTKPVVASASGRTYGHEPRGATAPGNGVELVSTETDDRLILEAEDNPDAAITSDTWEPVEP